MPAAEGRRMGVRARRCQVLMGECCHQVLVLQGPHQGCWGRHLALVPPLVTLVPGWYQGPGRDQGWVWVWRDWHPGLGRHQV